MKGVFKPIFLWIVLIGVEVTGCSTPRPMVSGKQGYFDRKGVVRGSPFFFNAEGATVPLDPRGFQWPLRNVKVTSSFGKRGKEFHEGIDLRASSGTPIFAAQSGVVLYSGAKIRGYGKLIVLRHRHKIATIYAHNSRLLVTRGQRVRRGQLIAISGATGHTRGPHLHFEVRKALIPLNPLAFFSQKGKTLKNPTLTASQSPY